MILVIDSIVVIRVPQEVEVMGKEVAVSSDGLFDVGNTKSDSDDEGDLF